MGLSVMYAEVAGIVLRVKQVLYIISALQRLATPGWTSQQ